MVCLGSASPTCLASDTICGACSVGWSQSLVGTLEQSDYNCSGNGLSVGMLISAASAAFPSFLCPSTL